MNSTKGITAVFLATVLAMPMAASADRDRDEARGGYGNNCYEHKGKIKCRGEKGNGNAKRQNSGGHQAAGGPPPWAPAHGWRRKNEGGDHEHYVLRDDDYYVHEESGVRAVVHSGAATVDVGIDKGTCNRKVIGTVVGGVIGGVVGNKVGDRENKPIATVLGAVIGGLVGHEIGRSMDKQDQHCTGQVLEQAADRQTIRWADEAQKGEYRVTPERTYESDGRYCRDYITEYQGTNGIEREKASACRNQDGTWQKMMM